MSYPITVKVNFDFSNGPVFGIPLTLNDPVNGILGTNVLADNASQVVDISSQTLNIQIRGGYNLLQDQFEVGTAIVRIADQNGDWNPQNPASPYYGKLVPMRKLRISAVYNGQVYYLFSGYTTDYKYTYPKNQVLGYLDITCNDGFRLMNLSNITTVTGAAAGQDTGTRINKILDTIGWPNSMRQIDTGDTLTQADPATPRTALGAIKNCEFTEQGAFYISQEGNAIFNRRTWILQKNGTNPTIFNQDGTGISFFDVKFAYDDKLIINQATIQRIGGTAQVYGNIASVAKYFPHSLQQTNLVADTDATCANIAGMYVATRQETAIRIDALTLDLTTPSYNAGIIAALGLNTFDTVQITAAQPGGSNITKTLQVVSVNHDITPTAWKTTFTTSQPINLGFLLNSTLYGVLDLDPLAY